MTTNTSAGGASEEAVAALQDSLGTTLPADYLDLLRQSNGKVSHGPDLFVILDPAAEVVSTTQGYGAPEFAPGLVIFGSDGCGNLLGIDTRCQETAVMDYVVFDACNIAWGEEWYRAKSLAELFEHLAHQA